MLSLNTNLPIEVVKKSNKLQEIKSSRFIVFNKRTGFEKSINTKEFNKHLKALENKKDKYEWSWFFQPSIADIIDNAEMLFWDNMCVKSTNKKAIEYLKNKIFDMYKQNKSIQEISEYILENIKE